MSTEIYEYEGLLFEWDINKNLTNIEKHGISFKEAATVFRDSNSAVLTDEGHSSDNEERFLAIGFSRNLRILTVCHCYRDSDTVRIISARRATKPEIKEYGGV